MNKILTLLIIPYFIYGNMIEEFNMLNSKSNLTIEEQIKIISIENEMGYPEKARLSLYTFFSKNKTKDYKKISNLLGNFDKRIIQTLNYLDSLDKKEKLSKKEVLDNNLIDFINLEHKTKKEKIKEVKIKNKKIKNEKRTKLNPQMIDLAITLSENLDNIDYLRAKKQIKNFKNDKYFTFLNYTFNNRGKKDIDDEKIASLNIPEGYHYLYSFYKKTNPEKSKKYKEILEKNYKNYLKYNQL